MESFNKNLKNKIEEIKKKESSNNFEDIENLLEIYPYSYDVSQIIEEEIKKGLPESEKEYLEKRFIDYYESKIDKYSKNNNLININQITDFSNKTEKKNETKEDFKLKFNETYLNDLIQRFDEEYKKGKSNSYWIEVGANKMTNNYYNNINKKIPKNTKIDQEYQKIKDEFKNYYYENFINNSNELKNFYESEKTDE